MVCVFVNVLFADGLLYLLDFVQTICFAVFHSVLAKDHGDSGSVVLSCIGWTLRLAGLSASDTLHSRKAHQETPKQHTTIFYLKSTKDYICSLLLLEARPNMKVFFDAQLELFISQPTGASVGRYRNPTDSFYRGAGITNTARRTF